VDRHQQLTAAPKPVATKRIHESRTPVEPANGRRSDQTGPVNTRSTPATQKTVSGEAAGCPNNNFTGTNPVLTTTGITLTISQGGQLLFTCTASNPQGLTGTVPLTC